MKKVILIGDSIRQGYEKYVRLSFEDNAIVYTPEDCCRFSSYILRYLLQWKSEMGCGNDVDLVHWNAGLWDCLLMPDGNQHTEIGVYANYLKRIYTVIEQQFPNAKQIFATSTAVLEEKYAGIFKRKNCDIIAYNDVAVKTLEPLGAKINDLHSLTKMFPETYYSDMTHFNTKEAAQAITNQIASHIEKILGIQSKHLDYDTLFTKQTEIIGL